MRTRQTSSCVPCALRFEAAARCPSCGQGAVDLTDTEQRVTALARLVRPTAFSRFKRSFFRPSPGCSVGVIVTGIILATFAGMLLGMFLAGVWGFMLGFVLVPVVLTIIWTVYFPELHLFGEAQRALDPTERVPLALAPAPEIAPGVERRLFRGTARAHRLLRSPVRGTECIAFRVAGTCGGSSVDDAEAVSFVLQSDDVEIPVEAERATVDIPVGSPKVVHAGPELQTFLEERGARSDRDELFLTEAVLGAAGEIEVEGTICERSVPDGYRGTRKVEVLRDQPGSPLVLRHCSSTRSRE